MDTPPHRYPDTLPVRQARDRFLAANHFSTQEYRAPSFATDVVGLRLKFPNNKARQRAVPLHDLRHFLTGYGIDWLGEAEIGAWELRAGCNSLTLYVLNGTAVLLGLFISPARVWRAFLAAKDQHTLYRDPTPYDSLLQMTIGELRTRLAIKH